VDLLRPTLRNYSVTFPKFCWAKLHSRPRLKGKRDRLHFLMGRVAKNLKLSALHYMTFSDLLDAMPYGRLVNTMIVVLYTVATSALQINSIVIGCFCLNYLKSITKCKIFSAVRIKSALWLFIIHLSFLFFNL